MRLGTKLGSTPAALVAVLLVAAFAAEPALSACTNPNALGVSRTVTIDAQGGPQFGQLQYRENEPLRDKEVVLTFDDGPSTTNTQAVLDALTAHCTKATFFMVGRMAVAYPHMVRKVAEGGHTIAAHTWSHPNLKARSAPSAAGEIELGISAVSEALGRPMAPFFRFPYLADSKAMLDYLKSRDISAFSIGIDSYDFRTTNGDKMRRTVMRQLESRGKGIILMHDIQRSTARGIRGLLDELKAKGFKVVHFVPKVPVTTIGSYDETASALHAKRNTRVSATPLDDPGRQWASPSASGRPAASAQPRAAAPAGPSRNDESARPKPAVAARPGTGSSTPTSAGHDGLPDWQRRALGLH
jgi:peptidoglycan-N-acetylglucosamine deacetylase